MIFPFFRNTISKSAMPEGKSEVLPDLSVILVSFHWVSTIDSIFMSSSDFSHDAIKPARMKRMKMYFDVFILLRIHCGILRSSYKFSNCFHLPK